ncbi:hypothetical protein RJ640_013977 [Escallonia rubra]|uniref:BAHD acyltransferase n=1 Tax=Escallonia rubra TaxID=112253 RepID=A0AA88RWU6_9ASTE|nr:hypothetical protein RJ640_013977 [Escallonia rubra]
MDPSLLVVVVVEGASVVVCNGECLVYNREWDEEDEEVSESDEFLHRLLQLGAAENDLDKIPFYPFARRINGNTSTECNDDGVPVLEVCVECSLLDLFKTPEAETLRTFLLVKVESKESSTIPFLIQVSFFSCGGMTIGLCTSHKIADAATLSTFSNGWASASSVCDQTLVAPELPKPENDCVTRRYVFGASSIATLKNQAGKDDVVQPTRVEAVSALVWKCTTAAASNRRPYVMS